MKPYLKKKSLSHRGLRLYHYELWMLLMGF